MDIMDIELVFLIFFIETYLTRTYCLLLLVLHRSFLTSEDYILMNGILYAILMKLNIC